MKTLFLLGLALFFSASAEAAYLSCSGQVTTEGVATIQAANPAWRQMRARCKMKGADDFPTCGYNYYGKWGCLYVLNFSYDDSLPECVNLVERIKLTVRAARDRTTAAATCY